MILGVFHYCFGFSSFRSCCRMPFPDNALWVEWCRPLPSGSLSVPRHKWPLLVPLSFTGMLLILGDSVTVNFCVKTVEQTLVLQVCWHKLCKVVLKPWQWAARELVLKNGKMTHHALCTNNVTTLIYRNLWFSWLS